MTDVAGPYAPPPRRGISGYACRPFFASQLALNRRRMPTFSRSHWDHRENVFPTSLLLCIFMLWIVGEHWAASSHNSRATRL